MKMVLRYLSVCTGVLFAQGTLACGFHNLDPVQSIVDQMITAEHLVLARPGTTNRFRFEPINTLVGGATIEDIPYLVDASTYRRLSGAATDAVLFAKGPNGAPWKRLVYVDADVAPVLDQIVGRLERWRVFAPVERAEFFAPLLDHNDNAVHAIALRELDQVSYGQLRNVVSVVDAQRLINGMSDFTKPGLHPIRILLLGLSHDPQASALIRRGFETGVTEGTRLLGAYATAFLELGGPDAAKELVEIYLGRTDAGSDAQELLIEALALNATYGDFEMQTAVFDALAGLVQSDSRLAASVARQFGARTNWSFAGPVATALRQAQPAPMDAIVLSQYLALANQKSDPSSEAKAFR